ncbi:MAG: M23 family metallopeptidase [bacterium]|nr:M23 family metallopeptidase [bacterium]
MRLCRLAWWLALVTVAVAVVMAAVTWPWPEDPPDGFSLELSFHPEVVLPGDLLAIRVSGESPLYRVTAATGQVLGREIHFYPLERSLVALVGIPSSTPAARYYLRVEVTRSDGEVYGLGSVVEVGSREFPVQHLRAGTALTGLLTAANLASDRARTTAARANPVPRPLWDGPFLMPVEGRLTTDYAELRYVNQAPSGSPHSGLDIAAPPGTPVLAAAAGVVVFSGDLHLSGTTVILDHGLNLFTLYLHLSATLVQVGEEVERGKLIGMVGSTGFSTGPHLHWTVSWGLVPVNPWPLLETDPLAPFLEHSFEDSPPASP